ncbi:hypothetical protein [Lampropedia aestuarii]|uniref:hypothetical protein n=1 Tax=Lampropedia aestuarii TaxID=2562762 RepID=UPI0024689322|nr:hypothetical protein [Lampropedia aestuarii]MDH5858628.1 hypothetical protein [Lampropedia aestuarii]
MALVRQGKSGKPDPEESEPFDATFSLILRVRDPADPLPIPHRVWVATGIKE